MRSVLPALAVLLFAGMAAAQSAHPSPRTFPMALVRNQCIEFTEVKRGGEPEDFRDCLVSKFDEFGSVEGQKYYYALYCLIPNFVPDNSKCGDGSLSAHFYSQRALAIFTSASAGGPLRLVFERANGDIGALFYLEPEILRTAVGTILYLPIAYDGTGHGNGSEYYLRERSDWRRIESEAWLKDLEQRLPAGLQIWKGVWQDLRTMQAEAGLYRQGDANCCPTGGVARIQLAIRDGKFVLESVTFEKAE